MKKEFIAPILITVIFILYYILFFGVLIWMLDGWLKYLLIILPLIICGVAIYVCIERIKEIRSGEEDDLGKY